MQISYSPSRRVACISPRGDLDFRACPELRQALLDVVGCHLAVLDFAEVTFLDSTAVGVIVSAARRLRAKDANLLITNAPVAQQRVLRLLGLQDLMQPTPPRRSPDLSPDLLLEAAG